MTDKDQTQEAEICFDKEEIDQMMTGLDEKNREIEELNNRLLRLQADFDNFRRRARSEKEELSQVVTGGILCQLLPVIDNFERALAAGPNQDAATLLAGVEMVYRQFAHIFEGLGIKPIVAIGSQFDPSLHEAVIKVEDPGQPDGVVVDELQKGYMVGTKVLRPSMVKVVSNS